MKALLIPVHGKFTCSRCQAEFDKQDELAEHLRQGHVR